MESNRPPPVIKPAAYQSGQIGGLHSAMQASAKGRKIGAGEGSQHIKMEASTNTHERKEPTLWTSSEIPILSIMGQTGHWGQTGQI